jgi:DNA polymerase III delta prime subunit
MSTDLFDAENHENPIFINESDIKKIDERKAIEDSDHILTAELFSDKKSIVVVSVSEPKIAAAIKLKKNKNMGLKQFKQKHDDVKDQLDKLKQQKISDIFGDCNLYNYDEISDKYA